MPICSNHDTDGEQNNAKPVKTYDVFYTYRSLPPNEREEEDFKKNKLFSASEAMTIHLQKESSPGNADVSCHSESCLNPPRVGEKHQTTGIKYPLLLLIRHLANFSLMLQIMERLYSDTKHFIPFLYLSSIIFSFMSDGYNIYNKYQNLYLLNIISFMESTFKALLAEALAYVAWKILFYTGEIDCERKLKSFFQLLSIHVVSIYIVYICTSRIKSKVRSIVTAMEALAVFLLMKILMDYIAFGMHNLKPIIISILNKVLEERWLTGAMPNIEADEKLDQHPTASSSLMRKNNIRLEESDVPARKQLDILSNVDFSSRQESCKTSNL
ncbi:uncharacterized protein LOC118182859, partial [Stegodyphus dumicola]|uniref:uncharacterized protein LOC118182859 n=1 Tax=Stegodyphus dumicola TaxID=202533 RepID=UPI0015A99127